MTATVTQEEYPELGSKRKLEEAAIVAEEPQEEEGDDQIEQEYRIWKKNSPLLYDLVLTHCLTWPSLTCDWLPDKSTPPGADYSVQKLILGTQTADGNDNHLMIMTAKIPRSDKLEEESSEAVKDASRLSISTMMCHPGEVNRALHNPLHPFHIATKTVSGEVLVFDYSQHPSKPKLENTPLPLMTLTGHTAEGYALAWSALNSGFLASGAEDEKIICWDTKSSQSSPVVTLTGHVGSVEAVSFHYKQIDWLLSAGVDGTVKIWDTRTNAVVQNHSAAHKGEVNCAVFCEHNEFLFASAGSDKVIHLWDVRKGQTSQPLFTLDGGHTDEVTNLKWSHISETIIASSGNDRKVVIWDLSRIGEELTTEEAQDGPPELLFIHGGHTGRVNDFSWTNDDSCTIASVADDNVLQIWQMAESVFQTDSDEEGDK